MTPSALPALANVLTVDLDRLADDGGPPPQAATRIPMNDWYRQLGVSHRRRDESAGRESRTLQDRDRKQETAARLRRPGIVAAMRSFISRYNEGAGLEVLTMIDDSDGESHVFAVTIFANGGRTLTLTASGADLCVRPSPKTAGAPDGGQRWITFDATDEAIAAYALQDWLTRL